MNNVKMVVDKNFLEDPMLEEFFQADPGNRAVIIDFVAIEGYSGKNSVKNICRSMAILSKYANQVLVLKNARELVAAGYINPNIRFELIDWGATRAFGKFCRHLERASQGDAVALVTVAGHAEAAKKHLAMMEATVVTFKPYFERIRVLMGSDALKARRERRPIPASAGVQTIQMIVELATMLFDSDPRVPRIEGSFVEARNYYCFRYATAAVLLALRWAEAGGLQDVRPEKLRNDFVDLSYTTAATYFDGLLTNDEKMTDIYLETSILVDDLFSGEMRNRIEDKVNHDPTI